MTFPTVVELPQKLEPLTKDTFVPTAGASVVVTGRRRIVD